MQMFSILDSPSHLERLDTDAVNKLMLANDWARLTEAQRVARNRALCDLLGLDWRTNPILLVRERDGRLRPALSAHATNQLEVRHNVSTAPIATEFRGGYVVVTVRAWLPNGREKTRKGAIAVEGKSAQAMADAEKWAETQGAKRASLALLGIGLPDESEALAYIGAERAHFDPQTGEVETGEAVLQALGALIEPQVKWYRGARARHGWTPEEELVFLRRFGIERIEDLADPETFRVIARDVQNPEVLAEIRAELAARND